MGLAGCSPSKPSTGLPAGQRPQQQEGPDRYVTPSQQATGIHPSKDPHASGSNASTNPAVRPRDRPLLVLALARSGAALPFARSRHPPHVRLQRTDSPACPAPAPARVGSCCFRGQSLAQPPSRPGAPSSGYERPSPHVVSVATATSTLHASAGCQRRTRASTNQRSRGRPRPGAGWEDGSGGRVARRRGVERRIRRACAVRATGGIKPTREGKGRKASRRRRISLLLLWSFRCHSGPSRKCLTRGGSE